MNFAKVEPAVLALGVGSFAATIAGWITQAVYQAGSLPGPPFDFECLFIFLLFGLLAVPIFCITALLYSTPLLLGAWVPAWLLRARIPALWTKLGAPVIGGLLGVGYFQLTVYFRPWPPGYLHPEMIAASYVGAFVAGSIMFAVGAHFHARSHRSQ